MKIKQKYYIWGSISIFLLYAVFMLTISLYTKAMFPDESWFYGDIKKIDLKHLLSVPNYLGYGSMYWIMMAILKDFVLMRVASILILLSVPICIYILFKFFLNASEKTIFLVSLFYFSVPLTWFTGKIIGPELLGYGIGTWGLTMCLFGIKKYKINIFVAGSILLGVSTGIKLNYVVFGFFVGIYIITVIHEFLRKKSYNDIKKCILFCILLLLFLLIGFICANPILIIDKNDFFTNMTNIHGFELRNVKKVLFSKAISWDFLNCGGMNNTIISVVMACIIWVMALRKANNKKIIFSSLCSILFLILICLKDGFLGWYLMPCIVFISFCIIDNKWIIIAVIMNLVLIYPNTMYQIKGKILQIQCVSNINNINAMVEHNNNIYRDFVPIYFIETCIDSLPYGGGV